MSRLLLAACVAALPVLATGQTIYKVQMPDGSVLFTDSVPAGGKVLEERESKNTPRVSTVPTPQASKGAAAATRSASPEILTRPPNVAGKAPAPPPNVSTAERELAVAKRRLELGREPLPGERRGLAGGGSRLTEDYEARIAALERDVAAAEERLKKAYEARRN